MKSSKMKLKNIIIQHQDGTWEIKETIHIKAIGFESVLSSGRKIDQRVFETMFKKETEELLDIEIIKQTESGKWELSIHNLYICHLLTCLVRFN